MAATLIHNHSVPPHRPFRHALWHMLCGSSPACRARNCNNNNWGVNATRYGLSIFNCQACPPGMVTSSDSSSYPRSASHFVDNGDSTGGFTSPSACVTPPGYGLQDNQAVPCPTGQYNGHDTTSNCTACPVPLTTAGPGAGVTAADCGAPAGYGNTNGSVVQCPIGEGAGWCSEQHA